jgi:hypothetical protein
MSGLESKFIESKLFWKVNGPVQQGCFKNHFKK